MWHAAGAFDWRPPRRAHSQPCASAAHGQLAALPGMARHRTGIGRAAEAHLAKAEAFQILAGQMKALERLAGRRIAQQSSSRRSPRGRYWALSKRKPASGNVLTLD